MKVLFSDKLYDLVEVDIDEIDIPEDRFRAVQDVKSSRSLDATLSDLPLINEIGLRQNGATIELIYGESRVVMLHQKNVKTARAKLWRIDPERALYMQLAENVARGGFDKAKLLDYYIQLAGSRKFKDTKIAQLLGVQKADISKLKTVAKFDDKIKSLFIEKDIPVDVMYELRLLSNDDTRSTALEAIVRGNYPKDTARHFIRHTLAGLCDKCKTLARERGDKIILTLYKGKYLCPNCYTPPIEKTDQQNISSALGTQLELEGGPAGPEELVAKECPNCHLEVASVLEDFNICSGCYSRLTALQSSVLLQIGEKYWNLSPDEIVKLKVSSK